MKLFSVFAFFISMSAAQADEWKTLNVPAAIQINKPSENPAYRIFEQVQKLNHRLGTQHQSINISADLLKDGKLYSANDFASMSDEDAAALVDADHCEIYNAFKLYQPNSALEGDLLLHVDQPGPINVSTLATGTLAGITSVKQTLAQEYFIVNPSQKDEVLAMVRCLTFLNSTSAQAANSQSEAYIAADTYAPFFKQLKQ